MVKIKGTTITLTRGDTLSAEISITDSNGDPYQPKEGEVVRFALKESFQDSEPIIEKVIDNETMLLRLDSADTKLLENPKGKGQKKTYYYDLQITLLDGTVDTFITEAELNVTPEVD